MINFIKKNNHYNIDNPNFSYFDNETYGCTVNGLVVFAEYFLLLNTFIPISLIVSLEFVKVA